MPEGDRLVLARTIYKVTDDQIKAMGPRVERRIQDAIYQLGRATRDLARSYCPKKTGTLAASIYVTSPNTAVKENGVSVFTKQSTAGYFRAINAAIKRSRERLDLFNPEDGAVHPRTQRPIKGGPGAFSSSLEKIAGISYKSYSAGSGAGKSGDPEGDVFDVQSVMEMGSAGRSAFFVSIGAAAFYAGFVEFGHIGGHGWVDPRPFMTPALAWAKTQLPTVVAQAMRDGMSK